MTEEFSLREPKVSICICGTDFCIELSQRTADICCEILNDAKDKLEQLRRKDIENCVSEADICEFLKESIDKLLGKGSVDRVFGKRRQELLDLSDMICYIVSKIRDGFERQKADEESEESCE
ncbi:MAG: hypothetical protein IJE62_00390 [Clostridia bacterium]|nr:hypothetical protein [Clostridia bacterium]